MNDHQIEMELQAFRELKSQGLYHPERKLNDKEIQQRRYTNDLKGHHRRIGKQPPAAKTSQQALDQLRDYAADLIEDNTSHSDRIPLMRAKARGLEISLRDGELQRLLWDARRATTGAAELLTQADEIDLTPTPWCWDGVVIAGTLNLLVSLPKIGKTSLLLAWIAAWHRGDLHFLERELVGTCPPVLIVGTDQPKADWARMMRPLGLVSTNDTGTRGRLQPPIIGLAHAGQPIHLDPEGIERISAYASEHHGLLVVVDSLASCMRPLGIAEESADFAGPIGDLMEAIEPHGATVVAIHHSNKGRAGDSATLASRGSTALPATASQIIKLGRVPCNQPNPADRRVVMETEGRGGLPIRLLIERHEDGGWISHGDAEAVTQAQRIADAEDELTDAHRDALDAVRELCANGAWVSAALVVDRLELHGKDAERTMRRRLDSMVRRGLLQSQTVATLQGRQKQYSPMGDRTGTPPTPADPSDVSDVSEPSPIREENCLDLPVLCDRGQKGSDASDTKDASPGVGGDGVRPPGADQPPAPPGASRQSLRNLWADPWDQAG
jgi:AAA domain